MDPDPVGFLAIILPDPTFVTSRSVLFFHTYTSKFCNSDLDPNSFLMPIRIDILPKFCSSAGLHCFFFLFSVIVLKFFNILDDVLKFSRVDSDTDPKPDRQSLDADQDLAK